MGRSLQIASFYRRTLQARWLVSKFGGGGVLILGS